MSEFKRKSRGRVSGREEMLQVELKSVKGSRNCDDAAAFVNFFERGFSLSCVD